MRRRLQLRRAQGGYILGLVLSAMIIGLTLITALLGMSLTAQRSAIAQQELAREQRAADGALDTAVTALRREHVDGQDPCAELGPELADVTIDGIDVEVGCARDVASVDPVSGDTKVLGATLPSGDAYGGEIDWAAAWVGDPSESEILAAKPSLVHVGDRPARFVNDVAVGTGAAVLGPDPQGPGAVVEGTYVQASAEPPWSPGCGLLGGSGRARIDAPSLTCGNPISAGGVSLFSAVVPPETSTVIPAACPSSPFVLGPGLYDAGRTAALNALMRDCAIEFRFQPGLDGDVFYFDAPASDGRALRFANDGASYAFGTVGAAQGACDPEQQGSMLVLSGSTRIVHEGGRLSVCGPGGSGPAVLMDESVPNRITSTAPVASLAGGSFSSVEYAIAPAEGAQSATTNVDCPISATTCNRGLSFTLDAAGSSALGELDFVWTAIDSPPVVLNAAGQSTLPRVRVTVTTPSGTDVCRTTSDQLGYLNAGRVVDLQASVPLSCDPGLVVSDLDGSTVRVEFQWRNVWLVPLNTPPYIRFSIRGAALVPNRQVIDATSAASDPTAWADPGNATGSPDGSTTTHPESCDPIITGYRVCTRDGEQSVQWLALGGFELPEALDATASLESLAARVSFTGGNDLVATPQTFPGVDNGEVHLEVLRDGSPVCAVPVTLGYSRTRNVWEIDLFQGGGCSALRTAGSLEDVTVRLGVKPEKGIRCELCVPPNPTDKGLELPAIDAVQLVATSNSVEDYLASEVTIDEANGSGVQLHGEVKLPRMALDVHWRGTASPDPLVRGTLEVNSLGSEVAADADSGIICCSPLTDLVRLTASIDHDGPGGDPAVVRGTAELRLDAAASPLWEAVITEWELCSRRGCSP